MSDELRLNRNQLETALGDDPDVIRTFELLLERVNRPYPVGSTYVQFPAAETNVIADAFPETEEPATLFGGTWEEQFAGESTLFFRTVGNETTIRDNGRTNGRQEDQFQGHLHNTNWQSFSSTGSAQPGDGAKFRLLTIGGSGVSAGNVPTLDGIIADSANGTPRTGSETRATNRLIKVWKRTA